MAVIHKRRKWVKLKSASRDIGSDETLRVATRSRMHSVRGGDPGTSEQYVLREADERKETDRAAAFSITKIT